MSDILTREQVEGTRQLVEAAKRACTEETVCSNGKVLELCDELLHYMDEVARLKGERAVFEKRRLLAKSLEAVREGPKP